MAQSRSTFNLTVRAARLVAPLALAATASACVADPQIATDHPYLKGELSCSTFDRVEATAFAQFKQRYGHNPKNDTEKLIAHWVWRVEHHQHADGNLIPYGKSDKLAGDDGFGFCRDGLLGLFSHSTGLCYSIHAQFTPFIQRSLGDYLVTSCTSVPGHTAFEAFTDGAWRLADLTCGHLVFDKDPEKPIGILDIAAAQGRLGELNGGFLKLRLGPFGDKLNTYDSVKEPEGEGKQKMFGYLGMPIVYGLRDGETFTRWRMPDGDDGIEAIWSLDYHEAAYDFPKHHGMARRETFMTFGAVGNDAFGRADKKSGRSPKNPLVYSGKGVFEYSPVLKNMTTASARGWTASDGITLKGGTLSAPTAGGFIIVTHTAPYQIAAHQADNADGKWDVYKNPCDKTGIFSGTGSENLQLAISTDAGQTWDDLGTVGKGFSVDFSNKVKGRFTYQLKVIFPAKAELSAFTLRTVVQIGPAVFPRLKDQGSQITYQSSNLGAIHGGPDNRLAKAFRAAALDQDAWKVYKIEAPGPIRSLHGVSMVVGRATMSVETSLDGKTWDVAMAPITMGRAGKEKNASIWGNGTCAFMWGDHSYPTNAASTVGYIRLKNADEACTQVYATYETKDKPMNLMVTVNWTDATGPNHEAHNSFKAGTQVQTWNVPTGKDTVTNWVKFQPTAK